MLFSTDDICSRAYHLGRAAGFQWLALETAQRGGPLWMLKSQIGSACHWAYVAGILPPDASDIARDVVSK